MHYKPSHEGHSLPGEKIRKNEFHACTDKFNSSKFDGFLQVIMHYALREETSRAISCVINLRHLAILRF
jgi:hypothetical protein